MISSVIRHRISGSINLFILECKYLSLDCVDRLKAGINLFILECKYEGCYNVD